MLVLAGMLVLVGVLFLGACGGEEKDAVNKSAATATAPAGEPIVIRATLIVAAEEGSEPIATGTVLEGSTLGGTPFCVGGTILESHASLDPKMGGVPDRPEDHLPGRHREDRLHAGGGCRP